MNNQPMANTDEAMATNLPPDPSDNGPPDSDQCTMADAAVASLQVPHIPELPTTPETATAHEQQIPSSTELATPIVTNDTIHASHSESSITEPPIPITTNETIHDSHSEASTAEFPPLVEQTILQKWYTSRRRIRTATSALSNCCYPLRSFFREVNDFDALIRALGDSGYMLPDRLTPVRLEDWGEDVSPPRADGNFWYGALEDGHSDHDPDDDDVKAANRDENDGVSKSKGKEPLRTKVLPREAEEKLENILIRATDIFAKASDQIHNVLSWHSDVCYHAAIQEGRKQLRDEFPPGSPRRLNLENDIWDLYRSLDMANMNFSVQLRNVTGTLPKASFQIRQETKLFRAFLKEHGIDDGPCDLLVSGVLGAPEKIGFIDRLRRTIRTARHEIQEFFDNDSEEYIIAYDNELTAPTQFRLEYQFNKGAFPLTVDPQPLEKTDASAEDQKWVVEECGILEGMQDSLTWKRGMESYDPREARAKFSKLKNKICSSKQRHTTGNILLKHKIMTRIKLYDAANEPPRSNKQAPQEEENQNNEPSSLATTARNFPSVSSSGNGGEHVTACDRTDTRDNESGDSSDGDEHEMNHPHGSFKDEDLVPMTNVHHHSSTKLESDEAMTLVSAGLAASSNRKQSNGNKSPKGRNKKTVMVSEAKMDHPFLS